MIRGLGLFNDTIGSDDGIDIWIEEEILPHQAESIQAKFGLIEDDEGYAIEVAEENGTRSLWGMIGASSLSEAEAKIQELINDYPIKATEFEEEFEWYDEWRY